MSNIGTQVSQLAFPLLVLFVTHSPAQAGFIGALRTLPYFLLGLPAGVLVDRWDRKRVMMLCDVGRALALGSIPVASAFGWLSIEQLYLAALIEGTLFVFFDIAEVSCLPQVVSADQLPHATAQNQAAEGTSLLLGPAVGGALYSLSVQVPFLADAITYLVSVVTLSLIRTPFQGDRTIARRRVLRELVAGVAWLWRQPLIFLMALVSGALNFLAAGSALVMIVLAQHQGTSAAVIGLILGIAGIGSIVGSLLAPRIQRRLSFGQAIITTIWVNTLVWPLYALAPNPLALGVITALIYLNGPIYNVVNITYRLALVPDELQGRVNSAVRLIGLGVMPLGLALTGVLLQRVGAVPTVLLFAVGYLVLALGVSLNPHLRHVRPPVKAQATEARR